MTDMIMAYGPGGCQEFLLSGQKAPVFAIRLKKQVSGADREVAVTLETAGTNRWFSEGKTYKLSMRDGSEGVGKILENGTALRLKSAEGWQVFLIYAVCETTFSIFRKYRIKDTERIRIGSGQDCEVTYAFQEYVSEKHASVYQRGGNWVIRAEESGICLNEKRLEGEIPLRFGDRITLFGLCAVWLEDGPALCIRFGTCTVDEKVFSELSPDEAPIYRDKERSGKRSRERPVFRRVPRKRVPLYTDPVEIGTPPALPEAGHRSALLSIGPSLTMAVPMLLGYMMTAYGTENRFYLVSGVTSALASALLGALWIAAGLRYTSREALEKERILRQAYGRYLDRMEKFLIQKQEDNRQALLLDFPSGKECCFLDESDKRFWNRSPERDAFLRVRLGMGTIPFQASIRVSGGDHDWDRNDMAERAYGLRDRCRLLRHAPFCTDLREKGVLGVVGGDGKKGAYDVIRNIVAQISVNYCYTDVRMAFFYEEGPETSRIWSFARWLPHVWTEGGQYRMIAGNKEQMGVISYEVAGIFRSRAEMVKGENEKPLPHYLLFIDSLRILEGELLELYVLYPGKAGGITSVILAERYEDLPDTCTYVIRNEGTKPEILDMSGNGEDDSLYFEKVDEAEMERLARRLCGIRVEDGMNDRTVPDKLDFLEMYGVSTLEELQIPARWAGNRSEESLRVPVGRKGGGRLCCVDIHEKYHGPHGLVAGMTGSGKSELLQTLVLSLAVNFSPEEAAFFVIDFKGGGMANLFAELPHMAGRITNLSGNRIQRALLSIKGENLRRQHMLAENGVNNINDYIRMYKAGCVKEPLPHLILMVDEFAELKKEEPEFMTELISVAQVGRSLGIHLILATQKPSGTVDERIWSNARFRLCLRVQDRQDSRDMLHRPDAAYLLQTGRAYYQVGNDEIYEEIQTAYSGAGYEGGSGSGKPGTVLLGLNGKVLQGKRAEPDGNIQKETQLQALVHRIAELAKEQRCGKARPLWLPPLPETVFLSDLSGDKKQGWSAPVGCFDDPAVQRQGVYEIVFPEAGHLAVCGMAGTGKSTFLQTLLFSLTLRYTPEELQFYVLDYSGGVLSSLAEAPHCGGVVTDTEGERTERFFYMLDQILEERKQIRRAGKTFWTGQAVILIVLDHFSGFQDKTGGKYEKELLRLAREGEANRIFFLVSGSGFGSGGIPHGILEYLRTVICLEMGDQYKYAEAMKVSRTPVVPEEGVRGRGIAYIGGKILEFQTALAEGPENGSRESVEERCKQMKASWAGKYPREIPEIPDRPTFSELEKLEEYRKLAAGKRYLPFGYFDRDASLCTVDLERTYCWLIQGRDGSGKRNVMRLLMRAAAQKEHALLYLIDLKGSGLSDEAGRLGAECLEDERQLHCFWKNLKRHAESRSFLFLADVAGFIEAVERPSEETDGIRADLEYITGKGRSSGIWLFGFLRPEETHSLLISRVFRNMASGGTGIHLGGNAGDQSLFRFSDLSYAEQSHPAAPGTGLIPSGPGNPATRRVVLPLAEPEWEEG